MSGTHLLTYLYTPIIALALALDLTYTSYSIPIYPLPTYTPIPTTLIYNMPTYLSIYSIPKHHLPNSHIYMQITYHI